MFQVPVDSQDFIRILRPWVKSVLQDVGRQSCRESLQALQDFAPGDRYFLNTSWPDVASRGLFKQKLRHRSKPYCCSLCPYSADMFSSLKNHLHRCHEDEADQELQIQCPDCSFVSRPSVVSRHFSLFHEMAARDQSVQDGKPLKGYIKQFTCLKCSFSNTTFGSMKKHVLLTHFQFLLSAYVGFQSQEEQAQPEASNAPPQSQEEQAQPEASNAPPQSQEEQAQPEASNAPPQSQEEQAQPEASNAPPQSQEEQAQPEASNAPPQSQEEQAQPEANTLPPGRYYCKKCGSTVCSQDGLMSHILTSDLHKDLENKLRSVISERNKRSGLLKQVPVAPKPRAGLARPANSSAARAAARAKPKPRRSRSALSKNSPSLAIAKSVTLAQPVTPAQVQPPVGIPGISWSLTDSVPTAAQSHMAVVSSPLPVAQTSLTLQPPASSTILSSGRASPNKPIDPPVLPVSQPLGPVKKSVRMSDLPVSQVIPPGPPLTQPMGSAGRPARPLVRSVEPTSRQIRPGTLSCVSASPGVLQTTSPGAISVGQVVSLTVLPEGQKSPASVIPVQRAASGVLSTGPEVQPRVLHVDQAASAQALPSCQTVSFRVIPADQVVSSGLLSPKQLMISDVPVNQDVNSGIPLLGQPVTSGVLPAGPPVRPNVLQLSQSVGAGISPVSQPVRAETSQNTMFPRSDTVFRKLLPTGTQINGKPIFMLDPVPVTLPIIPQGASLMIVTPSQVPNQVLSPSVGPQMSSALPSLSSSQGPVNTADQNVFVQVSLPEVDLNMVVRQAKQWKTCPVCNVFFPFNVYQAHMEVAHKPSEFNSSERHEPVKLAVCAPFLKWTMEKAMRCLSCKCLVSEEELMYHLLTHGLVCLFCPFSFHTMESFLEHSRIKHHGRRKLSLEYSHRGFQLSLDANGDLLFPYLDFIITLPREKMGEQEVCLAILSGIHSTSLVPLYVKVRPQVKDVPKLLSEQELTCPLCLCPFTITEAYMLHLKDRHHVMPTAYTVFNSPAFKCIHCCGVYPGSLTTAAITLHLLHCECAPKDNSSDQQVGSGFVASSELQFANGEKIPDSKCPVKRKWQDGHLGAEDEKRDEKVSLLVLKGDAASGPEEGTSAMPLKRQRIESTMNGPVADDNLFQILALDPRKYKDYKDCSFEEKRQFLKEYFHKKPYPSRREVELLSLFLKMERVNVALFFGTRRYICLKAIEVHRPSVLLGFDMSQLKNVKHRLSFECEPQNSA